MSFLYGNNVHKSGLGRITEGTPQHHGVVVLSMQSVPLGFGVTARSTEECRILDPSAVVVYHQADAGGLYTLINVYQNTIILFFSLLNYFLSLEYLRNEETL